jgi:hypothetical protein
VADDEGVKVINMTDKSKPSLIGTLSRDAMGGGFATSVALSHHEDFALVADDEGVKVINMTDKSKPSLIGDLPIGFTLLYKSVESSLTKKEAISNFGICISKHYKQLEVRSLNDLYRIRGIHSSCCEKLSETLLSSIDLVNQNINISDCRINAFYMKDAIFDLHNHPLNFISFIVSGSYSHSIFSTSDVCLKNNSFQPMTEYEIYSNHHVINTTTDEIYTYGVINLVKTKEEYFYKDDLIIYNTKEIHRIDNYKMDTVSINYLSSNGDKIIDVFVSHKTPERKVLSKADTKKPLEKKIINYVINKSINIFMNYK